MTGHAAAPRLLRPSDKLLAVHVSYGNNREQAQACCARFKEVLEHNKVGNADFMLT